MSIAEAALVVRQAAAEETGRVRRRDTVIRLLGEADALMEELEQLNLAGRKRVPPRLRLRLVAFHAVVVGVSLEPDDESVCRTQDALDAVFDAAEIVLQWRRRERDLVAAHDPGDDADEPEARERFRERAVRLAGAQAGVTAKDLLKRFCGPPRVRSEGWLDELVAEGALRVVPSGVGRRYVAVGEGGGG